MVTPAEPCISPLMWWRRDHMGRVAGVAVVGVGVDVDGAGVGAAGADVGACTV